MKNVGLNIWGRPLKWPTAKSKKRMLKKVFKPRTRTNYNTDYGVALYYDSEYARRFRLDLPWDFEEDSEKFQQWCPI